MHFTWDISLGQVIVSVPIFWLIYMLMKVHAMMLNFRIEHEVLMRWYANSQDPKIRLEDLPTRRKFWW